MSIKKYSNGSWVDIPYRKYGTEAETLTNLPADVIADGQSASADIIGNMSQSGTPTPQNPIQPSECGDRTENLFNKNGEVITGTGTVINVITTGIKTIVQTQGSNRYSAIKLDNGLLGKTITVSANITQSASNKAQIRLYYANGRYATNLIASITTAGQTGYIKTTYTMPSSIPSGSDGIAIVLSADKDGDGEVGDYVNYADLMIVEGSTAPTSYIPYGYKIPISSGGITTPVYLGEVQSTRQIKKLVLTGEETGWQMRSGEPSNVFFVSLANLNIQPQSGAGLCDKFKYTAGNSFNDLNDKEFIITANNLGFRYTDIQNASAWVLYLQQQYSNGTPVTIWYVLATPTTGIVNEPIRKIGNYADSVSVSNIPTTGTAESFDVDTTLKPSEVDFTYHGWHPKTPKESNNGQWS